MLVAMLAAALVTQAFVVATGIGLLLATEYRPASVAVVHVVGAVSALVAGRLLPPAIRSSSDDGAEPVAWDGIGLTALAVAALALLYALALALFTPPAEVDALAYHLPRIGFWLQEHGLGGLEGVADPRLAGSPPASGLLTGHTIILSGSGRFVGLAQWFAVIVSALAVVGIARRLGASGRAAVLVGSLVPTLPIVALQAPTALNDVIVASLIATAVFFLLGETRADALLALVAVALAVLTKTTAAVALPFLLVLALTRHRGGHRVGPVIAVVVGAALGAAWLLAPTHSTRGTVGGVNTSYVDSSPIAAAGRISRLLTETLELPGGVGRDQLLLVIVGGLAVIAGVAARRQRIAVAGLAAAATPVLMLQGAELAARAYRKFWYLVGRRDLELLDVGRPVDYTSATGSWYGAVGLAVIVGGFVIAVRSRRVDRTRGLLALAPLLWIVGFGAVLQYSSWQGRFMLPGVLLGLGAAATLFDHSTVRLWLVLVSSTTLALVWIHSDERPAGIDLFVSEPARSVWTRKDADALGAGRGLPEAIRAVKQHVPRDGTLAIFPAPFPDLPTREPVALLPWGLFGTGVDRKLLYAGTVAEAAATEADWALLPRALVAACEPGWSRRADAHAAYQLLARTPGASC